MKIVFLIQGTSPILLWKQAYEKLSECQDFLQVTFIDTFDLDHEKIMQNYHEYFGNPDFYYIDIHSGLPYFQHFDPLWKELKGKIPMFVHTGIEAENSSLKKEGAISPVLYEKISTYLYAGGIDNLKSLFLLFLRDIGKLSNMKVPQVMAQKWDGIYSDRPVISEEELKRSLASEKKKIVIGILIHYDSVLRKDFAHIDALINTIRKYDGIPYAVYTNMMPNDAGYGGLSAAMEQYFKYKGASVVDALIVTTGHSLTALAAPGKGEAYSMDSVFQELDVPIFQAMTTYYTYEQWEKSLAGIDSMLLCSCVFQPEFDGQIITVPIAYTEQQMTDFGVKSVTLPIMERVEKVVRLARNWGRLRKKKISDKKIAIILHNMPPRADMIGCAYGLDTPESVYEMYQLLKSRGLHLEYDFKDGQEIIGKIIEGTTNDNRYLSEEEMLARCQAFVSKEQYLKWFEHMPPKVREELVRDWGEAPGEFMTVEEKILIPGIFNGNLFIGLQPPRAMDEKAEEAYHSTDIVCPHQYLAFYRYLEEIYGADIVVHVGTHGTIEWLPGKEIGLSSSCYPDLAIGNLPHIYPYIIDVPGEGVQAKRRTGAVILDHCIPSMTESGVYGILESLDEQIDAYYHAKTADFGKLKTLEDSIWADVLEGNFDTDLSVTEEDFRKNPEKIIEKLHLWIMDIKSMKIKDGLHIFGKIPPKERFWNLARMLVSIGNGEIPSLLEGIAQQEKIDLEELLLYPQKESPNGCTNAMLLSDLEKKGKTFFEEMADFYEKHGKEETIKAFASNSGKLEDCLRFVLEEIVPRLMKVTDELTYFLRAIDGKFVGPGPSGAPTRGNAKLLPTGRNFYTVDPTAIPSRSAWKTGMLLADQLLEKYLSEQGEYPENIAIVVYSGETMKTRGDDIAEILYLYGVKPVWLANTDRVIGLEVIPLEELGRPRIDVILRISGLFRDTFPNLIERIDEAVNLIASLSEPEEMNYVQKHIREDMEEFLSQGMKEADAYEQASLRVFGCPAGTYGAGVDIMINSKQWTNSEDLARAYINWSSHGYSKKMHGEKLENLFTKRLRNCQVTVKNISSFEADMLDSDDFYNYHGGLVSAVKAASGKTPHSFSSNAADPSHVSTHTIEEETARIMRARICNPIWQNGLKEHGYKGAQEFSAMVDILFGWDATSNVAKDWMYEAIASDYLLKKEMREWMKKVNPFAVHAISERLLEASKRGMWEAKKETLNEITKIYLSIEGDIEDI